MKQISYFCCNFKTTEPILIILFPWPKLIEAKLNATSFTKIGPVVPEKLADKRTTYWHAYTHIDRRTAFLLNSVKNDGIVDKPATVKEPADLSSRLIRPIWYSARGQRELNANPASPVMNREILLSLCLRLP